MNNLGHVLGVAFRLIGCFILAFFGTGVVLWFVGVMVGLGDDIVSLLYLPITLGVLLQLLIMTKPTKTVQTPSGPMKIESTHTIPRYLPIVLPALILLVGGLYWYQHDKSRVKKVDSWVSQQHESTVALIGNAPLGDDERTDKCHMAEQGPFTSGNRWCFITYRQTFSPYPSDAAAISGLKALDAQLEEAGWTRDLKIPFANEFGGATEDVFYVDYTYRYYEGAICRVRLKQSSDTPEVKSTLEFDYEMGCGWRRFDF